MNDTQRLLTAIGKNIPLTSIKSISENDLYVKQYKLKEIIENGYDLHNFFLATLLESAHDMLQHLKDTDVYMDLYMERHKLTKLDMVKIFSSIDKGYATLFQSSMNYFIDEGLILNEYDSERVLIQFSEEDVVEMTSDVLDEIITLVKYTHHLIKSKGSSQENPYDEKTRALLEKMKRNREKVDRIKRNAQDSDIQPLWNVISSITVKSNSINKINIMDLTLFQIYDEYHRLYAIENYNTTIQAIMNGAKVDMEQWDNII